MRALASVLGPSFCSSCFHFPAFPSLHGRYPLLRYYGRSDSRQPRARTVCPAPSPALAGLPDYRGRTSGHSVSNHQRVVRGLTRLSGVSASGLAPALQASSFPSRLAQPRRPNRVHGGLPRGKPVLRTGRSRSGALHPASRRRSSGSIPHGSSPHRGGLPPPHPLAFSGALAAVCDR